MDWIALIALFACLLVIGFLSGIEAAFLSADKLSIELRKKQGKYSGRIWSKLHGDTARFVGATLVGINIFLIIYGLLWSTYMRPLWELKFWARFNTENPYIRLLVEIAAATSLLILIEFTMRAWFRAQRDAILSNGFITYFVQLFYNLLAWIAGVLIDISEWLLKYLFNVKLNTREEAFTKVDLEHFIQQSKSHDEEESNQEINQKLFQNALSLSEVRIRECLVPRKEIEGVDLRTSIAELRDKFMHTKLSKLIVYDQNIDTIVGYVHQLDLFKRPNDISSILLPISVVPESMNAPDLMNKFSKDRKSIAWVVDEFGGTAGIVTMEDLLEELFGDIHDEYDTEEFVEKQIATNEFILSGRLELDYLEQKYHMQFPERDEAETLSGYIIQTRDEIPKQKEIFTIGHIQFDILHVSDTRVETVKMRLLK